MSHPSDDSQPHASGQKSTGARLLLWMIAIPCATALVALMLTLMGLAIAYTRAARYPENAAYILRNVPTARDGLTALARLDPATIQTAMEAL